MKDQQDAEERSKDAHQKKKGKERLRAISDNSVHAIAYNQPQCTSNNNYRLKGIALERKEAKYEKEQAEQYERLLTEQAEAKTQHCLFQLYIHDKSYKVCIHFDLEHNSRVYNILL